MGHWSQKPSEVTVSLSSNFSQQCLKISSFSVLRPSRGAPQSLDRPNQPSHVWEVFWSSPDRWYEKLLSTRGHRHNERFARHGLFEKSHLKSLLMVTNESIMSLYRSENIWRKKLIASKRISIILPYQDWWKLSYMPWFKSICHWSTKKRNRWSIKERLMVRRW